MRISVLFPVIGLALALMPAPAANAQAAQPQPVQLGAGLAERQSGVAKAEDCAVVRKDPARYAAKGATRVGCVETIPQPGKTAGDFLAHRKGVSAIDPLPAYCNTVPIDTVWYANYDDRTRECMFTVGQWILFEIPTGRMLGYIQFLAINLAVTRNNSLTWKQQIEMEAIGAAGEVDGVEVQGSFRCTADCVTTSSNFPAQDPLFGIPAGEGTFVSTLSFPTRSFTKSLVDFYFTQPNSSDSNSLTYGPGDIRCDSEFPGGMSPGCVFYAIAPWVIYSLSNPDRDFFSAHVFAAQSSGLPGRPGTNPLTRTTSQSLRDQNRAVACVNPGYPRPAGFSCDEYPFASTYQGAAVQQQFGGSARTFPGCSISGVPDNVVGQAGWSVCMIPEGQNTGAGIELNNFYIKNRIIDVDPFFVAIVN